MPQMPKTAKKYYKFDYEDLIKVEQKQSNKKEVEKNDAKNIASSLFASLITAGILFGMATFIAFSMSASTPLFLQLLEQSQRYHL